MIQYYQVIQMDYDKNYIETIYDAFELNEIFIKEFIQGKLKKTLE